MSAGALVAGLRELADWLDAHPELPPRDHEFPPLRLLYSVAAPENVWLAAAMLNVPGEDDGRGHTTATRDFGQVCLHVFHVADEAMARYAAETSYHGAVTP